jgi:AraC-like DNA-binding protein
MYQRYPIALRQRHERFDLFQGLVTQLFCPMHIDTARGTRDSFSANLETLALESTQIVQVSTSALVVRRRSQDIARIDDPPYLVKFQMKGESLWSQRGREVHLKPGDFVIGSTAEPYSLTVKSYYEMPVLVVARSVMHRLTPEPDRFLGVKLSGEDADCGLLSSFVGQAVARMSQLSGHMARRVEVNILDLLGGVLSERAQRGPMTRAQQLAQIKQYVADRLHDRELTPASIAAYFGLSTRSVHAIFECEELSIGKYIRKLRVAGCRKAVESAEPGHWSLTDLALVWGFYDLSHMTRCFRAEYGAPPGQFVPRSRTL